MLGLDTYCPICGMDVERETGTKRFGKYFCSEDHVLKYAERRGKEEEQEGRSHSGGCC